MDIGATLQWAGDTSPADGESAAPDRFRDRAGRTISIEHWARLRADYEYTVIGDWSDGDGAAVRTVWTGVDGDHGHSENLMFETHYLVGDTAYFHVHGTDTAARQFHDDCVEWLSSTTTPPVDPDRRAVGERRPQTALPLNFFDRQGNPITMTQWARLRRNPNYCVIDRWRGEGGAHIEVFWAGFDRVSGFHARPQVFGLCVSAFENCPLSDCSYRFFTESRALDHFDRIVPLVERGVRPWDDEAVEAAGFEPLTLRAW